MRKYLLLLFFVFVSCATPQMKMKERHEQFLSRVERQKMSLSKEDYGNFLSREISRKELEKRALLSMKKREGIYHSHQEQRSQDHQGRHYDFQTRSTEVNLKNIDQRIKIVDREIFFLRSQQSSLEK